MRVAILLVIGLFVLIAYLIIRNRHLNRLLKAQEHPELLLPRKERRAYARELLKRERDRYETDRQQELVDLINKQLDQRI